MNFTPRFDSYLSQYDGMPPLWPRAPEWPFDERQLRKRLAYLGIPFEPKYLNLKMQRRLDTAYRHFQALVEKYDDGSVKETRQWIPLILTPSGRECLPLRNDTTMCTAMEFKLKIIHQYNPLALAVKESYVPPADLKFKCDTCKAVCTSECGACGEVYCSRNCMAKNWSNHRSVCETVWEKSGNISAMLTHSEMTAQLTKAEVDRCMGCPTPAPYECLKCKKTERAGAKMKQCSRCYRVYYCSRECQREDWRYHKLSCKPVTK